MSRVENEHAAAQALQRLLEIMRRLRDPHGGCPWDCAQDFHSIAAYTLEEAYEVVDAIEHGAPDMLCDELGDLLFQVVFHARMAEERGWFGFAQVAAAIANKLERRHPHVFGDVEIADAEAQTLAWEAHKRSERMQRGYTGVLAGVPLALPALTRAAKLQKRAARIGLDWPDVAGVLAKLQEELDELAEARADAAVEAVNAEIGDILFTCVNLARHLDVDPEAALRAANARFEARVAHVEAALPELPEQLPAAELDRLWKSAKQAGL
ncbi:MAG TPA: nucleoside triphosphate pyrophosphohydrolase [Gammaproteobacteria bacterium]